MKKNYTPNMMENLIPDYKNTQVISLEKQSTLRILVGVLGMLLPLLIWLLLLLHSSVYSPLDSISHYFYARAGTVFIIIVSLLAIFLLVYKGYESIDFILSSIAGVGALLLLYFPTYNIDCNCNTSNCNYVITHLNDNLFREKFHIAMAGIFLGSLALMSIFLFTKKKGDPKGFVLPELKATFKSQMQLSMLMIINNCFWVYSGPEFNERNLTFWFEVIALEAFGFSWFVKGDAFEKSK